MDMAVDSEAKKPRIQEEKKYQDITALIARSVLVQDMTLRELVGGVMHTFVIEKDHSVTTAMKQAGDSYYTKTKGKKPEEHQLGPPHIHVCQAMLQALAATPDTAGQHSKLKEMWDSIFNTRETACATVRICKLMKAFKSTDMKIAIYIRHTEEASLVKALVKAGAKLQEGRAPAGGLARDIQKWLDTQAAV